MILSLIKYKIYKILIYDNENSCIYDFLTYIYIIIRQSTCIKYLKYNFIQA
jgi:hypothetical protein